MGRRFDALIHRSFYHFGLIIHRYRLIFFVGSILFTIGAGYGITFIVQQTTKDPEFVFSPVDAPWRFERGVLREHWPLDEENFWPGKSYDYNGYVDVLVAGKMHEVLGRPNILHAKYLDEIERINNYIIHNLTVPVSLNGKHFEVAYTDLCMTHKWKCYLNDHITMLMPRSRWGNFSAQIAEFAKDVIVREVNITYPIGWRGSEPIYFGALVGRPRLTDAEGHFDYASAIRLTFNTREQKVGNISRLWRRKLTDYLTDKERPASTFLEFGMYHNESLPDGLQDVADELTPKFAGTCTILFTFCFAASVVLINHGNGVIGIDWVRSKPIVTTAGLFVPLISIITAFGLILWTGELYNAIVNVSPFLVLCIGIDDLFVMSSAWHRTSPEKSPAIRIAETLEDAAVAITITSITDILTFGIGVFTPLPGVRMFCLYASVQCVFTYIYQLTFFSPVLAYAAEMEAKGIHSLFFCKAIEAHETRSKFKLHFLAGSIARKSQHHEQEEKKDGIIIEENAEQKEDIREEEKQENQSKKLKIVRFFEQRLERKQEDAEIDIGEETLVNKLFRDIIGPFLLERNTQICALLLYLLYITVAITGIVNIQEGLSPKFLVREHFYLAEFYELIDETLWQEGLQMQVVVNNPPDLFDRTNREMIQHMINSFEGTMYTMQHNATMLWLTAYEAHLQKEHDDFGFNMPNNSIEWYQRCRDWLLIAGGRSLWEKDMVWSTEDALHLKAFRFQIGLRNYRTPSDHTASCKLMRSIAKRFPEYNVTTFHEYYPFADQYIELIPSLINNFLLGVSTMTVVTLIMIPDWRAALSVVAAITSINLGVLGYMTFWGVHLDAVSMITVIMCIGFAVDLSAHIAYAYSLAYGTNKVRAVTALEELGWPVFLGAFSTILGIMVLTLVDSYIVQIFFKTVFLVIFFSMIHGLFFLPILLMFVIPKERKRKYDPNHPDPVKFDLRSTRGEEDGNGNIVVEDMNKSDNNNRGEGRETKKSVECRRKEDMKYSESKGKMLETIHEGREKRTPSPVRHVIPPDEKEDEDDRVEEVKEQKNAAGESEKGEETTESKNVVPNEPEQRMNNEERKEEQEGDQEDHGKSKEGTAEKKELDTIEEEDVTESAKERKEKDEDKKRETENTDEAKVKSRSHFDANNKHVEVSDV